MRTLSQKELAVLAERIGRGEIPPEELGKALVEVVLEIHTLMLKGAKDNSAKAMFGLFFPLALCYGTYEAVQTGRLSPDAPDVKAAEELMVQLLSYIMPRVTHSLRAGDALSFSRLAAVLAAAQEFVSLQDPKKVEPILARLLKQLGVKAPTLHQRTQRLRMLLPLWYLGMNRLSYSERWTIFEKAGISIDAIPEEDTLRKMISYYNIPKMRAALEKSKENRQRGEQKGEKRRKKRAHA